MMKAPLSVHHLIFSGERICLRSFALKKITTVVTETAVIIVDGVNLFSQNIGIDQFVRSTTEFFVFQQSFLLNTTFRPGNSGLLRVYVQAF